MADVFDVHQKTWNYKAVPSGMLYNTRLLLPPLQSGQRIPNPQCGVLDSSHKRDGFLRRRPR